jgi:hypothetical protein
MQFLFVTTVPKYLKFVTYFKDLLSKISSWRNHSTKINVSIPLRHSYLQRTHVEDIHFSCTNSNLRIHCTYSLKLKGVYVPLCHGLQPWRSRLPLCSLANSGQQWERGVVISLPLHTNVQTSLLFSLSHLPGQTRVVQWKTKFHSTVFIYKIVQHYRKDLCANYE